MKKSVLLGFSGILIAGAASAEFQTEFNFALVEADEDGFFVEGTYHFNEVDTSKGPLELASFLDRATSVTARFSDLINDDGFSLDGRFVLGNDFIIEAGYMQDPSTFNIGAGTYLSDSSEISLTFENNDDANTNSLTVDYFEIKDTRDNRSYAYDVGFSVIDGDGDDGFGVGGNITYYFQPEFSVGVTAGLVDVGDFEANNFVIDANYFFSETIAIFGSFSRDDQSFGDFEVESDTFIVGVTGRF